MSNRHSMTVFVCVAVLATLPLFGGGACSQAQEAKAAAAEPQYINQFFLLGSDGKLVALESEKMTHEMKSHNHFISNSVSSAQAVPNASSPVRVGPDAHFVVKVNQGMGSMDPNTFIALKPFVVEKGERTLPMNTAKAGMFQGVKSQQASDTSIALTFKKYGDSSMEVAAAQPLKPGEYVLTINGTAMGVYCFGVDAK